MVLPEHQAEPKTTPDVLMAFPGALRALVASRENPAVCRSRLATGNRRAIGGHHVHTVAPTPRSGAELDLEI
jgi:hypothetical protein